MSEPPADVAFHCALCPERLIGIEAGAAHLVDAHGLGEPERWPDGGIVIHAPQIEPEEVLGLG